MAGPLHLLGGDEFTGAHAELDARLLDGLAARTVTIVPTAAAYERPERLMERAATHYGAMDATVDVVEVLTRSDAADTVSAARIADAALIVLVDGSTMHLEATLKRSPVLDALRQAHDGGAVLVASGASARVLCDPMVDPRGGAFAVGFGLVRGVTVVTQAERFSDDREHRTRRLLPSGVELVVLASADRLDIAPDGSHQVVRGRVAQS